MIKLSLRLSTIVEMVPPSVVCDVGSDHGKLMIALYEANKISQGYAIENKKGPYEKLLKALQNAKIDDYVVPLFCDGISYLPSKVETIVIAGMGGDTIIKILKDHPEKLKNVKTIIVDPHSEITLVRSEISQMGYVISDEKIIKEDGIFYEIIKFTKADIAFYSEADLEFGPILRNQKSALFKEKYQNRINEIDNLLLKELPLQRYEQLNKEKEKLEGIL